MIAGLICAAGAVLLIAIYLALAIGRELEFNEQFPAISDAEFMALCSPGTNPEIALRVRKVLADALNVDYERIHPSARIQQDLGAE